MNRQRRAARIGLLAALLLLAVLALAACGRGGSDDATPFPTPTPLPAVGEEAAAAAPAAVEAPAEEASQPESPLSPLPTPTIVPTPTSISEGIEVQEDRAAVVGRALYLESGQPIIATDIRLAEVYCPEDVKAEEKNDKCFWTIDDARSPYTQTGAEGVFKFLGVEARDYAILVGSVLGSYALAEGDNGKPIIYTLPAGEITDVGVLEFETP